MAGWNGSGQRGNSAPIQPKAKAKKPSPIRGLIAGGVVVVLAVVAYFAFFSGSEKPQAAKPDKERGRIKAVTPAAAPKNRVVAKAETPVEQVQTNEVRKPHFNPRARRQFGVGNRVDTNDIRRTKSPYSIFKNRAENHLAFLANVPLGTTVVGGMYYTPKFMKDLEAAMVDKIEILDTDTEEQKQIKQSVIDMQKELRQRLKAGEDIVAVLKETYDEIQRMGVVKQQIESEVRKISRDQEMSNEDVGKVVEKANEMLAEKGIAPIQYNTLTRRILAGHVRRAAQAEQSESKSSESQSNDTKESK